MLGERGIVGSSKLPKTGIGVKGINICVRRAFLHNFSAGALTQNARPDRIHALVGGG